MIIERENNNSGYRIIEEYAKTYMESKCKKLSIEAILGKRVKLTKPLLPMMIDDITRLDDIRVTNRNMVLTTTLLIDANAMNKEFEKTFIKSQCNDKDTRSLMNMGATFQVYFKNKEGKQFGKLSYSRDYC